MESRKPNEKQILRIAKQVKLFLHENNKRYADLAEATGLTEQAISNQLNLGRPFSAKSAEKWAAGFESMGLPINESFLLTGFGHITDIPEIDPESRNYSFSHRRETHEREEAPGGEDIEGDTVFKMTCQFLRMRDERNALHDRCLDLMAENHMLKEQLDAIRRILGQE